MSTGKLIIEAVKAASPTMVQEAFEQGVRPLVVEEIDELYNEFVDEDGPEDEESYDSYESDDGDGDWGEGDDDDEDIDEVIDEAMMSKKMTSKKMRRRRREKSEQSHLDEAIGDRFRYDHLERVADTTERKLGRAKIERNINRRHAQGDVRYPYDGVNLTDGVYRAPKSNPVDRAKAKMAIGKNQGEIERLSRALDKIHAKRSTIRMRNEF